MDATLDLLRAVVRGESRDQALHEVDWLRLLDLTERNGVLLLLGAHHFVAAPGDIQQRLHALRRHLAATNLRTHADLAFLLPLMDRTGVAWSVVKGPVLSDHWYGQRGLRSYTDLDVLVDPAGFPSVLEALQGGGAVLVDTNWSLACQQQRAELTLLLPHGTPLDLHWHLLNTPELRQAITLVPAQILSRCNRVDVRGLPVPTLDQIDTILHLCLHTMLSGGRKLLWYRDIAEVTQRHPIVWDELVQRAAGTGAELLVATALSRTADLLGRRLPEGVLDALAPHGRGWLRAVHLLDQLQPLGRRAKWLSGQLVAASGRRDTASSLAQVSRAAGSQSRLHMSFLVGQALDRWHLRSPTTPAGNPLRLPPSSPSDRHSYMRYVMSHS